MKKLRLIISVLIINLNVFLAQVVRVPQDFNSIQEALNICDTHDTVLVMAGTYYENLIWPFTNSIKLISEDGPKHTIIDGSQGSSSVIAIVTWQDSSSLIDGFTITGGTGTIDQDGYRCGGGIYCYYSSPVISNNIIKLNEAEYGGGIQFFHNSNPIIKNNLIDSNYAASGGGIEFYDNSEPTIIDNIITNNTAETGRGGGVSSHNFVSFLIKGNVISHNYAALNGGGIKCTGNSASIIRGNTISYNEAPYGSGIDCVNNSATVIDSNVIEYNIGQGIGSSTTSSPLINYNDIHGNTTYGIFKSGTNEINAEHNWWGDPSGPGGAGPGSGDSVSLAVDYDPWLSDSVVTSIEDEKENYLTEFVLWQNFPNPFNPSTIIKYSIPRQSFVTLKLFDVLGSEVSTLVNEEKPIGNYEVEFDASNLTSGVYFYRISASDFIATKKMILIK